MRLGTCIAIVAILALVPAGCGGDSDADEGSARSVTLALDFQPNAVHAGIYTAVRKDIDARHGVRLRVRAPSASTDSLKLLTAGRADFSIVDIHDFGLARQRGADVVGVGGLVQRQLGAIISRPGPEVPGALEGHRVGVTGLPSDEAVLTALVRRYGGDPDRVERVTVGFSAIPAFISRRVDAIVAFWNAEGVVLRERGVKTQEFRIDNYGQPPWPELLLVTTRRTLREQPRLVRDVVATLRDGTLAAIRNPKAASAQIAQVSGADEQLVRAQLDEVTPALGPPMYLDHEALVEWADWDVKWGLLKAPPLDVEEAFPPIPR